MITLTGVLLDLRVAPTNLAMLYLAGVVFISLKWGLGPALMSSLISTFAFDFLFISPYLSFAITDAWYLLTLVTLMGISLLTSFLTNAVREQALAAREREAHTVALYSLTQSLSAARIPDEIFRAAADHVKARFGLDIAILLHNEKEQLISRFEPSGSVLDAAIQAAATDAFRRAGSDSNAGRQGAFQPLKTAALALGVMVLLPVRAYSEISGGYELELEAIAVQVALAIERTRLEEKARDAEVLRRADELRRTLLNSVSHSLRVSVGGDPERA